MKVTDKHYKFKFYTHNNTKCLLCIVRKKLIKVTPEEEVRQAVISHLIKEKGVPLGNIDVEVPLSRFETNAKGRADIVVYNERNQPLLTIECKNRERNLLDKDFEQLQRYDDTIWGNFIALTNGIDSKTYLYNKRKKEHQPLERMPLYSEMLTKTGIIYAPQNFKPYQKPPYLNLTKKQIKQYYEEYDVGEDTPKEFHSLIYNITGFLFNQDNDKLKKTKHKEFGEIEDIGLRYSAFGNPAGGSWEHHYRSFILKDLSGTSIVLGVGIMGGAKYVDDPKWGNVTGDTKLIVSIDSFEKSHNSIQLRVEKFAHKINEHEFLLWHDGTLTHGNKGPAKKIDVINFVKKHSPNLVQKDNINLGKLGKGENVILGKLDNRNHFEWNQKQTKDTFLNLFRYAILRDEFRASRE